MSAIVRQLQIDLITDTSNGILIWFESLYALLDKVNTHVFTKDGQEFIYYNTITKKAVFYINFNSKEFLCDYTFYWGILESSFGLKDGDIRSVTMYFMETIMKTEVISPEGSPLHFSKYIKNALSNIISK